MPTHSSQQPAMPARTSEQPADAPARITDQDAYRAEQLRAHLTDFWRTPLKGYPLGADLTQALIFTKSGADIGRRDELASAHLAFCVQTGDAYDETAVWVAPHAMTHAMREHTLLAGAADSLHHLEEAVPAPDGLICFPHPIEGLSAHPIHALAWQSNGGADSGKPLSMVIHTITETSLIPTLLPATAHPHHWAATRLSTNSVTIIRDLDSPALAMGDPGMWGAPTPTTALLLTLAFWDLRPPSQLEDERAIPQRAPGKGKKNRKNGARPARRRVRIIREHTFTGPTSTPMGGAHHWSEDTLRWRVKEQWQRRCPNPHRHAEIIASGGTCEPVKVRVKAHDNGPVGRPVDDRRTVYIAATPPGPADQPAAADPDTTPPGPADPDTTPPNTPASPSN